MKVRIKLTRGDTTSVEISGPVFVVEAKLRELAQRHHDVFVRVLDAEHGEFLTLPEGCYDDR
jgi:hypothetical protein